MTTALPQHYLRFLGLLGTFAWSCTAQLDDLQLHSLGVKGSESVTTTTQPEPDGTEPAPTQSNLGGTEGTSSAPDTASPTCSEGLLNSEGFCVPEVHCAPGTFITEMNGSPACAPCASGSFSLEYDASECVTWQDCPLGQFVAQVGTSNNDRTCEPCPDGESTTVMNAGECSGSTDCPAGSFKQQDQCEPCSAGSYCSGKTEEEVPCESGTWDDDLDPGTPCIIMTTCTLGQFVQDDGSTTSDRTCEFCPSETYSGQMNATACVAWTSCATGTHVDVQGTSSSDRACVECEAGSFSAIENAAACATWSTCTAPEQYASNEPDSSTDRVCGTCPTGEAAASDNASECAVVGPANLVTNGDFEAGTEGWQSWEGGVLSTTEVKAHSGYKSLLVTGTGTGPAATVLDSVAQAGATYVASFWVSVGKVATAQVNLTRALVCGGSTTYLWFADNTAVPSIGWSNLTGSFTIPSDCASPQLMVYAEGSGSNVDLYVDDVSVTQAE